MITGLAVLKMVLMPSSTRLASAANSGPRWSMMGVSIARRIRSGSGVGPGICRKWRPATRDEFFAMGFFDLWSRLGFGPAPSWGWRPNAARRVGLFGRAAPPGAERRAALSEAGRDLDLPPSRTNATVSQVRSGASVGAHQQLR